MDNSNANLTHSRTKVRNILEALLNAHKWSSLERRSTREEERWSSVCPPYDWKKPEAFIVCRTHHNDVVTGTLKSPRYWRRFRLISPQLSRIQKRVTNCSCKQRYAFCLSLTTWSCLSGRAEVVHSLSLQQVKRRQKCPQKKKLESELQAVLFDSLWDRYCGVYWNS